MSDPPDSASARRFIDLATCPFGADDELRVSASTDLARRIEASPQTTKEVLEDVASRLEKAERSGWRKRILAVVGAVALVSMIVTVGATVYRFIQFRGFIGMVSPILNGEGSPSFEHVFWNLSPDARLLLFGNASAGNEAERWKPLWERDRSNPAYLQAYAEGCLSGEDEIPQELLEQAEAIDPGNAYLATLQAGSLASSAVERKSRGWSARKNTEAPTWVIKDEARFVQAYDAFRNAAGLPGFTDHSVALCQERFRYLPPGRDFLERVSVLAYNSSTITQKIHLIDLTKLLAAKATTLDGTEDLAEFRECIQLWRWLAERSADTSWTLLDGLITRAIVHIPLKNFSETAARLGLEDASREFRMLDERLEAEKEHRKTKEKEDDTSVWIMTKGSVMADMLIPSFLRQLNSPPAIAEEDLRPGRLADHALLGQVHATIAALCFGLLMLGALLSRTLVPNDTQRVALRLADVVSPRDQMWLLVAGILGPIGLYFAMIQIPHLSARDWSMRITAFLVPASQLAALTLLMINLTIALGARLTRKRLPMFATAQRSWRRCLPWFGVACSVLLMLGCGAGYQMIFEYGIVLFMPAVCWPLAYWVPRIFRKLGQPDLCRVTLHQVLAPVWAGAVIVSCLLFAFHRFDESKWTQRDRLMAPDAEARGFSYIEGLFAKQLALETRELVKVIPQL